MKVTDYIAELIAVAVTDALTPEHYSFFDGVYETLQRLQPDKPEDRTTGFLAFSNGPDKPRMKIKTGRFLCKKLNLNNGFLSEARIQDLTTAINVHLFPAVEIKLCDGAEITKNYENHVGNTSCMSGCDCHKTKLYEFNPDRYRQLVMFQVNDSARAMVVKLDNGDYLMDRIYTDSKHLINVMRDYARENGWYYRDSTSVGRCSIGFNGEECEDYNIFKVSGLYYEDGAVPYADTLTRYEIASSDKLDIFHKNVAAGEGILNNESGYLEDQYVCYHCGENAGADYVMVLNEIVCVECANEHYGWCEECNEYCNQEDMQYVESVEQYVCED